jgi:hypothetical protein
MVVRLIKKLTMVGPFVSAVGSADAVFIVLVIVATIVSGRL